MLPQVIVRSMSNSNSIKYHIHKHFQKLHKISHKIIRCRISVDIENKHHHKGKVFSISIDITIPGKELVTRKQNQNVYIAIRDGFYAIEKLLQKYGKRKSIVIGNDPIYPSPDNLNPFDSIATGG